MSRYADSQAVRNAGLAAAMRNVTFHQPPTTINTQTPKTMAYERRNGDIRISENTYKNNDRQPDMRGTAVINGKEYRISLWKRTNERGDWYSGEIEEAPAQQPEAARRAAYVQERNAMAAAASDTNRDADNPEDDLPF